MRHPLQAFIPLTCWLAALLVDGCTWEPVARPVQPQLVFEGPVRVERMLDGEGRFALVQAGMDDQTRWRIVDAEDLAYCELPADVEPIHGSLAPPRLNGSKTVQFLQPARRLAPEDHGLYFVDEACKIKGPIGELIDDGVLATLGLRIDQRQVLLVRDEGRMSVVDPWTDTARVLAEGVQTFRVLEAAGGDAREPEALWLIEKRRLTLRALDGTLLLSLGSAVTEFTQRRYDDGLRVAFRDGGDLFEAKGPEFVPELIAANACHPAYRLTSLDLHVPCAERQLVRVELTTGEVRRFPAGVIDAQTIGGFEIELTADPNDPDFPQPWVVVSPTVRVPIHPKPILPVSPLGSAAVAARTRDGGFGAWNLRGEFTRIFTDVRVLIPYRSVRTSELEWLMLHDMQSELGRLSTFEQRDVERAMLQGQLGFQPRTFAEGVPEQDGFRLAPGPSAEPIVLTRERAHPMVTVKGFAGTLHARLLSGSLEARIDEGVSSNLMVSSPQPGILYAISEGPKRGLWFAAL